MKRRTGEAAEIPDKVYFRIGEVSSLVGVDPHVLRFWESEFHIIRPTRARSNHRLYRRKDVENLLRIKRLLHDEGYTIAGARKALRQGRGTADRPGQGAAISPAGGAAGFVREIRHELEQILHRLRSGKSSG